MSQRFTDAELAAEKWHKMYLWRVAEETRSAFGSSKLSEQRDHEASTIIRFARLPHGQDEPPTNSRQCSRCSHEIVCPNPELLDAIMTIHQENGCTLSSSDFPY